jgi:ribosomal protein S18 acetylase RimI-like enzyme
MVGPDVNRVATSAEGGATSETSTHPLDNPAWSSLTGPHAHLAQGTAKALRYPPDVSPFVGLPPDRDDTVWAALHELVGSGGDAALSGSNAMVAALPADWQVVMKLDGVQMVATEALVSGPDSEAVVLGAADAEEMSDLVARTQPGPFRPKTYLLGGYLGIRRNGALVAMAGERMRPPGWTEISAICTDPAYRGQGLAARLTRAVAHGIRERGETPLLHAAARNVSAIRLYESLGFTLRRHTNFLVVRTPGPAASTHGRSGSF